MSNIKNTYIIRISKKSHVFLTSLKLKTGMTFVNLIDYSLGLNTKINDNFIDDINISASKDLSALDSSKSSFKLIKPTSSLIDSFILICWKYYPDIFTKSRQNILELIRVKLDTGSFPDYEDISFPLIDKSTWAQVFPKWFKNNAYRQSNFQIYIDNRLKYLVSKAFLLRSDKGMYELKVNFSISEWELIESITKLPPQVGLVIPNLLKSPKERPWPLVYRDIFSNDDINDL